MPQRNILGSEIQSLREGLGMRGDQLAKRARISASYLTRIEKGDRQPRPDVAARIAKALDVPLDVIYPVPEQEPAA